jgi:peroxiredoxin
MFRQKFLILAIMAVMAIGTGGCASTSGQGTSTRTPSPHASSTPALARAPRVGDAAPDFALATLDGSQVVHLSDFRGKPVLLYFWSTSCSLCVKELPLLQHFESQQSAAAQQMVVLGVDFDAVDNFVKVATLQQHLALTFPLLVDDQFQVRTRYRTTAVPHAYFLDQHHLIRSIHAEFLDDAALQQAARGTAPGARAGATFTARITVREYSAGARPRRGPRARCTPGRLSSVSSGQGGFIY